MNVPDWVHNEVITGLQALLVLRLRGAPAEDAVQFTSEIWGRAFARVATIEGIDRPRITEAFSRSFPMLKEWPPPAQIIELMPPRPERVKLPEPPPDEESQRRLQGLYRELAEKMSV